MPGRPLQHRTRGVELLQRMVALHDRQSREVVAAAALLGPGNRLVRTLDLIAVLSRQLGLSLLALGSGGIALAAGAWAAKIEVAAAGIVALVLVVALAALTSSRRSAVRELFIDGCGDLPLGPLERERQRLTSPRTQAGLARAVERLLATAIAWTRIQRNARPVFDVRLVRAAAPLLNEIVIQLRRRPAPPRSVARIEWLLGSGGSPLYGHDSAELRNVLELISRELRG